LEYTANRFIEFTTTGVATSTCFYHFPLMLQHTPQQTLSSQPAMTEQRPGVMQMIDTLSAGGAERVAVNLANLLPVDKYRSFLCATRQAGPLRDQVNQHVTFTCLQRKRTLDLGGLARLVDFIRTNQIGVIHAHATALFVAAQVSLLPPFPQIIWHDHHGRCTTEERPAWIYRLATWRARGIICVNDILKEWAATQLHFPAERVWYIPNFVVENAISSPAPPLPGVKGKRVVCVANLRPEKDHGTLIKAFAAVTRQHPDAHLFLAGGHNNPVYAETLQQSVSHLGLASHVSFLGEQRDIGALLRTCDVGVLSSASEGLPLALLEYGIAGLPAIATRVGQCPEVLDEGNAGLLVPPGDASQLAEALLTLLNSPEQQTWYSNLFQKRIATCYSPQANLSKITRIYDQLLKA
jgi:glycosyltransferase involved in cell wall biosynthesis